MRLPTKLLRTEWPPNDGLRPGDARFETMLESVVANGVLEPLTINLNWMIVDGHHRLAAARLVGIETVEVRIWTGTEYVS